jgi:hypothetical protein
LRIPWVVLTGLAVAASGCEAPGSRLESASRAIVAGDLDTGDPAIMELLGFKGNTGVRCTATVITPHLLIAAAHCIVETPGFQRFVFPGNDDRNVAEKDMLPVKTVVFNPLYGNPRQGNDFCIVVLDRPLAVRPIALNRASLDNAQGKSVRYVGYGLVTVGDSSTGGIKRQNTAPLAQVSNILLTIAPNAHGVCEGDSGGPMLLDDGQAESIIGVGSFVDAPACRRDSFYQRVDTQLAWIDEQIQKYEPGGTAPPADGGVIDAGGPPVVADASATPDVNTPPAVVDAQVPAADSAPPMAASTPDAGRGAVVRPASHTEGGCSYSRGPRHQVGGALMSALLALAWALRRRRR